MRPLKTTHKVLILLSICSPDENFESRKLFIFMVTFGVLVSNICAVLTDIVFFRASMSIDLENSLYALFQLMASLCVTYLMIVGINLKQQFDGIFAELAQIQNACK